MIIHLPKFVIRRSRFTVVVLSAAAVFLVSCGKNEDQKYQIQGDQKVCSVIDTQPCGITVACEGDGFYYCVSN